MRTVSAAQTILLNLPDRSDYIKVEVDSTGSGDFVDLCNLDGRDYVNGASWGETADGGVADATIELQREHFYRSLSPMRGDSIYTDYIVLNRAIRIKTAVMPLGVQPVAADFQLMFSGRIAKLGFGGRKPKLTLGCLDDAGDVQARFVETQADYGSALGDDIEDVMQDILDDTVNTAPGVPFTLDVPASPGFGITTYQQTKQVVLEALRSLADLIGWEVRMRFDSGSGTFKLTFYTPDRTGSTVNFTFSPESYWDINALSQDIDPIRNAMRLIYDVLDDPDTNARSQTIVDLEDAPSIALYGRRYMEITEASSSQIDSTPEATAMLTAALSDLKLPGAEHSCAMRYFWPAEVGDYYTFEPNGIHYDTDFSAGSVAFRHTFSRGNGGATTIQTRGKPSTGVNRWLAKEARLGNAPGTNVVAPAVSGVVGAAPGVGSLTISFDEPLDPQWRISELYLSTGVIASPTYPTKPSSALLVASGRVSKFTVSGLTPGQAYYALVLIINDKGRWGSATAYVQVATQMVAPYHENWNGQQDGLLRNNDFNQWTLGTDDPPDQWEMVTGSYAPGGGDDTVYVQEDDTRTGARALDLFYGATPSSPLIESQLIPFQGGDILRAAIVARQDPAGGANTAPEIVVGIVFYDSDPKPSGVAFAATSALTTTYNRWVSELIVAPDNCRFVKIQVAPDSSGDPFTDFTLQLDKASVIRGKGVGEAEASGLTVAVTTVYTTVLHSSVGAQIGVAEAAGVWTIDAPGQWRVRATLSLNDSAAPAKFIGYLQAVLGGTAVGSTSGSLTSLAYSVADAAGNEQCIVLLDTVIEANQGDTVTIQAKQATHVGALPGTYQIDLTQIVREETS